MNSINYRFQILEGLYHIHLHGIFHRDMKPENILISTRKKIKRECDHDCVTQENDSTFPSNTQCYKNNLTDNVKIFHDIIQINDDVECIVKTSVQDGKKFISQLSLIFLINFIFSFLIILGTVHQKYFYVQIPILHQ